MIIRQYHCEHDERHCHRLLLILFGTSYALNQVRFNIDPTRPRRWTNMKHQAVHIDNLSRYKMDCVTLSPAAEDCAKWNMPFRWYSDNSQSILTRLCRLFWKFRKKYSIIEVEQDLVNFRGCYQLLINKNWFSQNFVKIAWKLSNQQKHTYNFTLPPPHRQIVKLKYLSSLSWN